MDTTSERRRDEEERDDRKLRELNGTLVKWYWESLERLNSTLILMNFRIVFSMEFTPFQTLSRHTKAKMCLGFTIKYAGISQNIGKNQAEPQKGQNWLDNV